MCPLLIPSQPPLLNLTMNTRSLSFNLFTNQYVLDFVLATLDMVQHHVLEDVLPVLQLVHLVVCVSVQHRPAQELGQRLDTSVTERKSKDFSLSTHDRINVPNFGWKILHLATFVQIENTESRCLININFHLFVSLTILLLIAVLLVL